jgi:hypothetical protein
MIHNIILLDKDEPDNEIQQSIKHCINTDSYEFLKITLNSEGKIIIE